MQQDFFSPVDGPRARKLRAEAEALGIAAEEVDDFVKVSSIFRFNAAGRCHKAEDCTCQLACSVTH